MAKKMDWGGFGNVYPICLGAGPLGSNLDEVASYALLDAFLEAGGSLIDTAHIYGAWIPGKWGASERTIGSWMRSRRCRDRVILATKGGSPTLENLHTSRCGPDDLRSDITDSLKRLNVDYVDMYYVHRDDPERPVEDIVGALASFQQEGIIATYGVSNWSCARVDAAVTWANSAGVPAPAAVQNGYALADYVSQEPPFAGMLFVTEEDRDWHTRNHFPLAAYTAQASGYFGEENVRWAQDGFPGPSPKGRAYDSPQNRRRLLRAIRYAEVRGMAANTVALAYLLHEPFPVLPIIGTTRPERVTAAFAALEVELSEEEHKALMAAA